MKRMREIYAIGSRGPKCNTIKLHLFLRFEFIHLNLVFGASFWAKTCTRCCRWLARIITTFGERCSRSKLVFGVLSALGPLGIAFGNRICVRVGPITNDKMLKTVATRSGLGTGGDQGLPFHRRFAMLI